MPVRTASGLLIAVPVDSHSGLRVKKGQPNLDSKITSKSAPNQPVEIRSLADVLDRLIRLSYMTHEHCAPCYMYIAVSCSFLLRWRGAEWQLAMAPERGLN